MSTEKIVMNALFGKTELASQKIELANINDFVKYLDITENALNRFNKIFADLDKLKPTVISDGEAYISLLDKSMDASNELFAKFKEIGLDWIGTPEYKRFKSLMTKGDRGTIQTMVARVKNI